MKFKLKEKYLPAYHKGKLLDQILNLKQTSFSVIEYLNQFEKLILRWNLREKTYITVRRFINGLRKDIKPDVDYISPRTLEDAYHRALEMERYIYYPTPRKNIPQANFSRPLRPMIMDELVANFQIVTCRGFSISNSSVNNNPRTSNFRDMSSNLTSLRPTFSQIECFQFLYKRIYSLLMS